MNSTARHLLTSVGTSVLAGSVLVSVIASRVNEAQYDQDFQKFREDALAISVAAQNMMESTRECGYSDTGKAENMIKQTAALAEFDVDFLWASHNDVNLTIEFILETHEGQHIFTLTDDLVILGQQEVDLGSLSTEARTVCEGLE